MRLLSPYTEMILRLYYDTKVSNLVGWGATSNAITYEIYLRERLTYMTWFTTIGETATVFSHRISLVIATSARNLALAFPSASSAFSGIFSTALPTI
jgi:hypothetical protein